MRIDISDRHCQVSEVRRAYIARRLQFAFSRAEPHIIRIAVFLTDLNSPRGGPDKQCRMVCICQRLSALLPHRAAARRNMLHRSQHSQWLALKDRRASHNA